MITARLGAEAGREVFAVPGSPLNPLSRGCNRLLRDGAGLLESIDDLLPALPALARLLAESRPRQLPGTAQPPPFPLAGHAPQVQDQRRLWQALDDIAVDLDELAQRTGLTVARLSAILLDLELAGWALQTHGRWQRSPKPPSTTASFDAG
jgi:DNA processing protein